MLPNPYLILGLVLALAGASYTGYRHGVKTTADKYQRAIVEGQVQAEIATRRAVEAARVYERGQRLAMASAAEKATAQSRAEAEQVRKRLTALQRAIQEAADADPSVDAWRNTPIPEPIRVLVSPGDPNAGG